MEYLSYRPERPPPPCLHPASVQLPDPDTARLVVVPDSEQPKPHCPLQVTESTPTGDLYQGQVLGWRWEGLGSLTLPSGVRYEGQFRDGHFHGTGTLHFPTGSKYDGQWESGICTNGLYTFSDGLSFSHTDWKYCQCPDRRYWSEVQHGLRPAGRSQVTDNDPPRHVPAGLCDAGDGLYDPRCRTVYDYGDTRKIRRVVTDDDHQWITAHCQRGGDAFMGRREELHQDLTPQAFRAGQSKRLPMLPQALELGALIGQPSAPREPPPTPLDDSRERSAAVVREVLRSAQRVATSVHAIVSGAAGRVAAAEEEARQIVTVAEERVDSASSAISSLLEAAQQRLASSSGSSSDWSSAGSSDESRHAWGGRGRRTAHAAVTDSSSGESVGASAGSRGTWSASSGGSVRPAGSGGGSGGSVRPAGSGRGSGGSVRAPGSGGGSGSSSAGAGIAVSKPGTSEETPEAGQSN